MATERQIQANRANAAKSTGPITPEGKRISSRNAALPPASDTRLLKGQSLRRFQDIQAAIVHQLQPTTPAELTLINTMTLARWRWLGAVKNQTDCLNGKMSQLKKNSPEPVRCKALFAAAFLLACNSRSFARLHRLEAAYHRQYNRALAALLELHESRAFSNEPDSAPRQQKGTGLQ